jgi:F-type H+-transporting ATPase subunit gamma
MANLKEVRNRIASVSSTQQITKAMKMVSASKLRRAQDAIIQMRPFASKLKEILENLSSSIETTEGNPYSQVRAANRVLIIAITSNRGLCGGFNANIIKAVNKLIADNYSAQYKSGNVRILAIGKKASDTFSKNKSLYLDNHNEIYSDLTFANASEIARNVMNDFASGIYDRVEVVYNQFKNAAVQNVVVEQLLPIQPPAKGQKKDTKHKVDYILEPSPEEIVKELIPKSIKIQLYKALLDSHASEHGARMTAMNKATDNAGELIKALKLSYNKARQAAITNEILEIVGGANALKS